MRRLAHILIPLLALLASAPLHAATVPGAIPGSFGVSETGAATYSIPIAVPPGTAGMEPKLSLNYSSQGGNGIAGAGWSLGGLSAVTRCPQTIAQDGQTRGVQLDANDRFCLDGQRLIVVNGATYGTVGAEYRTEIESFSKVVSYGGTAGDPQYFKVWTKAGQIIEFGSTADSRVEAQGKTIAGAWAVNKISDTVGNYIAFTYFEDNANGEHRLEHIGYTGNAAAGVSPYNTVEFQYEARPDPSSGYLAGSLSQQTQRLSHVLTRTGGTLVMDYGLNYEIGTTTGRSRLASLAQCAANSDCLNPMTFGWQEGEAASFEAVANEGSAQSGSSSNTWFAMGDVNADGRTDAVTLNTSRDMRLYTANESGFLPQTQQFITPFIQSYPGFFSPPNWRFWTDDLNGDGYVEPIICGINGQSAVNGYDSWQVVPWASVPGLGGAATIQMQASYSFFAGTMPPGRIANYQGCMGTRSANGKGDLVWHAADYWRGFGLFTDVTVTATYGTLTWTLEGASVPERNATTSVTQTSDIDGDGNGDMVRYDPSTGALHIWLQRNNAFANVQTTSIDAGGTPSDRWFTVSDVNGDGLGDTVLHTPADGKLKVWLSKGDGTVTAKFETTGFSTGGTPSDTWFLLADVNADGRADAVKYTPSSGNITFAISYGDGTFGMPVNANLSQGYTYIPPEPSGSGGSRGMFGELVQLIATGFTPTPTVGPNPTTAWFQPADVNGDGLPDWVIYHPGEGKIKVNLGQGAVPDLLLSITDGHGAARSITYKPLTDPAVYTKGTGATYPTQDVQNATYVVSETAAADGIGGEFRNAYRYEGARANLHGRGFLGFATLEQTDLQTGIVTRTDYRQDFPYIGQPTLVTKTSSAGVELNRVENTHDVKAIPGGGQFPYLAYSKEQGKDLSGAILPFTETWNTYGDDWGNLTQVITQTSDGFRKQTDNAYDNDAAKWHLGRLNRASVTSTINGSWAQTRVSAFEYSPDTGLLTKEILEPDQPQLRLDTVYGHDAFGNRQTVTVSSPATGIAAIVTRSTTTNYGTKGQFPETVTNALSHTETKTFDPRFGTVATLTGPNNLTTTWQYDEFGRKINETRADGTQTIWTYDFCDAACPADGVYRIVTQVFAPGGIQSEPVSVAYFDRLNRQVRSAAQGVDGRWVYKDTVYDNRGNADKVSRPYYAGGTVYWIDHDYDDLNRLVQTIEPDDLANPALSVGYNGLTVTRTNRKNQVTSETRNSQDQKVSVTDATGEVTTYAYDPFGNLHSSTNAGNQIINEYDIRGRKTQTTDPDLGLWTYDYDALGELVKQTDAKTQITTFAYDTLGRMTSRAEPGLTSTWTWDGTAYGKGKLQSAQTSAGYIRSHYYDDKGRPYLTLFNLGSGEPMLFTTTVYDAAGRIAEQYYPSGFGVKRVYNALGHATELRNAGTDALYWKLDAQDAEGHLTQETTGNGVVTQRGYIASNGRLQNIVGTAAGGGQVQGAGYAYDTLGNVWLHGDDTGTDILTYDDLNRLIQTDHYAASGNSVETVAYDARGNIASKTGVGDYHYGGDPACAAGNGAGPHAVCQAGGNAYTYDANGNLTAGGGRVVGWTAWNMPASVTESGQAKLWLYGPEHDRYKMFASGRTTWYLNPGVHQGGHYERTLYSSGTVEQRHTLYGAGRPVGEVLIIDVGATRTEQTRYFHSDHQGSIVAVTDSSGAVLTRYRYDPWGKQTLVAGSNTGIDQTRQGHTGHEMLDGGLTHMNGRLYDPLLSRFVSADPIVQAPYNLQSLNRYSYVLNNPLGYTDPSGYFGWEISPNLGRGLFMLGGVMFGAVLGPAGPIFAGGGIATTVASGALAGGVGSFIGSGGNAQAARQGALAGGLFAGAGLIGNKFGLANDSLGRAALHAAAGCISASAGGGNCGTGAMTAGFTKFASANLPNYGDVGNLVKYAVIGGTASVIGGGKFANGAMTGAWQYLFNEVVAKYNSRTGQLSVRDVQTGKEANGNFFSGSKLGDGAAKGYYYILEGTYKDGQPRYRLEAVDAIWGDDENNNSGQSLLRLHGPGQSIGCITACDATNWLAVSPLIQNTATSTVQVRAYYWNPSVFGHQLLPRIPNGSESVRYYGILHVE